MLKKILVFLLIFSFAATQAPVVHAQGVSWISQFGTSGFDAADSIATDSSFSYVTGRVGSDLALPGQTSSGSVDAFIRKIDASGNEVWTRQFGTAGYDGFSKIAVDQSSQSLYVTGITTGVFPGQSSAGGPYDLFISKYDTSGNEDWTRQFGTDGIDGPLAIATNPNGFYVFGLTSGTFPGQTSAGGVDFFLAKFDTAGDTQWVRQFGTSGNDPAVFSLGGLAIDDTGIYVGSTVPMALPGQTSVGDTDAFLRKYDFNGNEIWTQEFGTACLDVLSDVQVSSGHIYVAGATAGDMANPLFPRCSNPPVPFNDYGDSGKAFVQAWSTDGSLQWTQQYTGSSGPTGYSLGISLAVDSNGIYAASEAIAPRDPQAIDPACPIGQPAEDIQVRMYSLEGKQVWTQQIGSTALDVPSGIAVNPTGIYVAGVTTCQLAGQTSSGSADAVVIGLGITP